MGKQIGVLIAVESGVLTSVVMSSDLELLEMEYDKLAKDLNPQEDDYGMYMFDEDDISGFVATWESATYALTEEDYLEASEKDEEAEDDAENEDRAEVS